MHETVGRQVEVGEGGQPLQPDQRLKPVVGEGEPGQNEAARRLEVGDRGQEVVGEVELGQARQLVQTDHVGHLVVAAVQHLQGGGQLEGVGQLLHAVLGQAQAGQGRPLTWNTTQEKV